MSKYSFNVKASTVSVGKSSTNRKRRSKPKVIIQARIVYINGTTCAFVKDPMGNSGKAYLLSDNSRSIKGIKTLYYGHSHFEHVYIPDEPSKLDFRFGFHRFRKDVIVEGYMVDGFRFHANKIVNGN